MEDHGKFFDPSVRSVIECCVLGGDDASWNLDSGVGECEGPEIARGQVQNLQRSYYHSEAMEKGDRRGIQVEICVELVNR